MIRTFARSAALAVALGLVLVGCTPDTPQQEDTTMDHLEAKAQLVTLLEIAQDAVGGEWDRSDTGARYCELGAEQGASYLLSRIGPGVESDDQQAIVDAIVAAWESEGVDAVVTTKPELDDVVVTQVRYPDTGVEPDGFYVEVWISERASAAGGQTHCATGDAAEINAN